MITFPQALEKAIQHIRRMETETCDLAHAHGRVLQQEIRADRDFPSFDRVMMDGFAVRAADLEANRFFRIAGSAPAGKPQAVLPQEAGLCLEIMTGAPFPLGADCIVPIEHVLQTEAAGISISPDFETKQGLFIHRAGSDAKAGNVLLDPGVLIDSRIIGVAASCGESSLRVSRVPRIAITIELPVKCVSTPIKYALRPGS